MVKASPSSVYKKAPKLTDRLTHWYLIHAMPYFWRSGIKRSPIESSGRARMLNDSHCLIQGTSRSRMRIYALSNSASDCISGES